ncbi:hypothetical protein [Nocardioides sp. LML1-1-1.1]|uniref:hypothetical protein n=1 Tax=Nocardioides sp. LML1-1-1.1 TaxID=3135248 RepID=UPI003437D4CA
MEHDLHLQADLFFGPCNDPDCPGAALAARQPQLELVWPTRAQERLIEDGDE